MYPLRVFSKFLHTGRNFSTSGRSQRTFEEFKELQRRMQVDDGVPVYLKKGPIDKLYFCVLALGSLAVFGEAMHFVYGQIYPPKKE